MLEGGGIVGNVLARLGRVFLDSIEESGFKSGVRESEFFGMRERDREGVDRLTFFGE